MNAEEDGFTLIEVLAVITLVGIIATVFLAVFSNYAASTNRVESELDATNLAQEVAFHAGQSEQIVSQDPAACESNSEDQQVNVSSLSNINSQFESDGSNRLYYTSSQNQTYDLVVNLCQDEAEKGLVVRMKVEVYRTLQSGDLSLVTEVYQYIDEEVNPS
ncbi:prepilin-type N-terminal cleavage/methylation domain-containing protein [Halobacillus sp. A1]|uniref:type II secretion system protein n=1 Tax=Halobacillus sp. A1 TaxID=2880262 RepID=UPI0020A62FF8|nr:prepilin-type N-terminal cleavage/methylation domain-containing protein [Halobacillus sp. A1]MCP3030470.1 prepilin-type N-terminal cleavage/methylation domain-containing protein [Halobacillus sp. A1]